MKTMHESLTDALADPEARILVHGPVSCDPSGNSRARQSVYTIDGELLFSDNHKRSYWYSNENERRDFERRGGRVLTP